MFENRAENTGRPISGWVGTREAGLPPTRSLLSASGRLDVACVGIILNIPPLISAENPKISADLPGYNLWAARCMYLLQGGRSVADIAMLYPIAAMQGYYHFDNGNKYGKYAPKETDYQNIGNWLTTDLRRDFTFLHPRTLMEKCSVRVKTLRLDNQENWQDYRMLILPAGKVTSADALKIVRDFWAAGGLVLATGVLPEKAAEFDKTAEVAALVKEIFGSDGTGAASAAGGRSVFVPSGNLAGFQTAVAELVPTADVSFAGPVPIHPNGAVIGHIRGKKRGQDSLSEGL